MSDQAVRRDRAHHRSPRQTSATCRSASIAAFRNLSDRPDALLMAILGGPDAGKVNWHPSVVAEARATGLSVDDDGNLIVEKAAE